jgi:hypothetical protein
MKCVRSGIVMMINYYVKFLTTYLGHLFKLNLTGLNIKTSRCCLSIKDRTSLTNTVYVLVYVIVII